MAELEKNQSKNKLRGLGCGSPKPPGKILKTCVDCGNRLKVMPDELVCPACDGPLTSSYDE